MSGDGAPKVQVSGEGLRIAIIAGSWHERVSEGLIAGARDALDRAGADHELIRVAGAFELPLAAQAALTGPSTFDAAVCLGVIIRGGTPHFDYIASAVTDGLTRVQLDAGRPVGFGVLTTDDEAQALDRAGLSGSAESKGHEAAEAVLVSVQALRTLGR